MGQVEAFVTVAQVEDRMCKKDKGSEVQRKVSCWPCTVVIESVQVCCHLTTWFPGFLYTYDLSPGQALTAHLSPGQALRPKPVTCHLARP